MICKSHVLKKFLWVVLTVVHRGHNHQLLMKHNDYPSMKSIIGQGSIVNDNT